MVFADLANRASLRAFLPYLFYEADLGVDRQTIEGIVENAVAMEIDLAAVGGLDEAIIVTGHKFRHAAMVLRFMRLDLTPHLADGVLDLALSRGECILDRDRDVLVLRRVAVSLGDNDILGLRHGDADIYLEQTTLPMPRLRRYDRHVAALNPVVEFLQPFGLLFDFGPNGLRRLGILKSDIERHLHLVSPISRRPTPGAASKRDLDKRQDRTSCVRNRSSVDGSASKTGLPQTDPNITYISGLPTFQSNLVRDAPSRTLRRTDRTSRALLRESPILVGCRSNSRLSSLRVGSVPAQ